jgi:hypothetical protein
MDLGARMSLIIYLEPWSESMVLPLRFNGFLLVPQKPRFLSAYKIGREIIGFGKNHF